MCSDQLTLKPVPATAERALEELDVDGSERRLAAEHAPRLEAPRARGCRCGPRAWGERRLGHCLRCGRDLA